MSKNLHKRLRELQRVAALHQNQPVTPIGAPVISDTNTAAPAAKMEIGTPEHYKVISRDLKSLIVVLLSMVALLIVCWWLVSNTALAQWTVNLGSSIR